MLKKILIMLFAMAAALVVLVGPAGATQANAVMVDELGVASESQASLDAKYMANPSGNCTNVIAAQFNPNGIIEIESICNYTSRTLIIYIGNGCTGVYVVIPPGSCVSNLRVYLMGYPGVSYRVGSS